MAMEMKKDGSRGMDKGSSDSVERILRKIIEPTSSPKIEVGLERMRRYLKKAGGGCIDQTCTLRNPEEWNKAKQALEELFEKYPEEVTAECHRWKIYFLTGEGKMGEARRWFLEAADRGLVVADWLIRPLVKAGEYEEAHAVFKEAVEKGVFNIEACAVIVDTFGVLPGKLNVAEEAFELGRQLIKTSSLEDARSFSVAVLYAAMHEAYMNAGMTGKAHELVLEMQSNDDVSASMRGADKLMDALFGKDRSKRS